MAFRTIIVEVEDNGPGVNPADYGEIIKPMVRLDAARSTDGTGLGLALGFIKSREYTTICTECAHHFFFHFPLPILLLLLFLLPVSLTLPCNSPKA